MKTDQFHKRIDMYLSQLKQPSDRLSQFYDACIIAKNALHEVDKLNKLISTENIWEEIVSLEKNLKS